MTALVACTKVIEDEGIDPFQVAEREVLGELDSLESVSIEGLYERVFSAKCALPTCHDGSFEPDFRTIQSTYNTLVYHPILKQDSLASYRFRVKPFEADSSWLIERLITENEVLGRMPLFADPLSEREMVLLRYWINNGAKDIQGQPAIYPNRNPFVVRYHVYNQQAMRVDPERLNGWASPFIVYPGWNLEIRFDISDDSSAIEDLLINEIHFSTDRDDFTDAWVYEVPHYKDNWRRVFLRADDFPVNRTIYFRYHLMDPVLKVPIEFPNDAHYTDTKESYSFFIK